jgi:hypothetical protein
MAKGLIEDYLEDERRRMMNELRNASINDLVTNHSSSMLTNSIGAQNTITNSIGASLGQAGMHKERGVVGDFRIEQVHGGFIVCIGREPYGPAERHIAITMEDVSRIVLSQLTSNMLEKT